MGPSAIPWQVGPIQQGAGPGTVVGSDILPGSIQSGHIADGSVGTQQIADAALGLSKFAGGITPVEIVVALPTTNLYRGRVVFLTTDNQLYKYEGTAWSSSNYIAPGTITSDMIAANAITAGKIQAAAIGTSKLLVGNFDNLAEDPGFEKNAPLAWQGAYDGNDGSFEEGWGIYYAPNDARTGFYCAIKAPAARGTTTLRSTTYCEAASGNQFYAEAWIKSSANANGFARVRVSFRGGDKYENGVDTLTEIYPGAAYSVSTGVATADVDDVYAVIEVEIIGHTTGLWYVDDIYFRRVLDSAVIADASIITAKIANLAVQNAHIENLSVTNAKVAEQTLTASKYRQVRNVIQIPFDDSVDPYYPLECFFQMPPGVVTIKAAKVWVQRKSFRQYVQQGSSSYSAATAVSSTLSSDAWNVGTDGGHGHNIAGAYLTGHAGSEPEPAHGIHYHQTADPGAHGHPHNHTIPGHSHAVNPHGHSLFPGIFETAPTGFVFLYVANDGVTYGPAVASGNSLAGVDITLTNSVSPSDRRIKIFGVGLMRVQVLVYLDLILELGV